MRMRRKKHREQRMENCRELLLEDISKYGGDIKAVFGDGKPLRIEIGCGKGAFITETAARNPDINFIAVEKCADALVIALERVKSAGLENVRFAPVDAAMLAQFDGGAGCDVIYINFCDPWKKSGYAKRRLTHKNYLEIYKKIVNPGGAIYFKTDNRELFDFSLKSFDDFALTVKNVTYDLAKSDFSGNVTTEYEKRFTELGIPICRCEAYF